MMSRLTATAALLCSFILVSTSAAGSEKDVLHALLNAFLEGVDTIEAHERFWADDLVYTSSNGSIFVSTGRPLSSPFGWLRVPPVTTRPQAIT